MAAAYLFYLCKNQAFIDGNKRTALGACHVFLRLNDCEPPPDGPEWEWFAMAIAANQLDHEQVTERIRKLIKLVEKT